MADLGKLGEDLAKFVPLITALGGIISGVVLLLDQLEKDKESGKEVSDEVLEAARKVSEALEDEVLDLLRDE